MRLNIIKANALEQITGTRIIAVKYYAVLHNITRPKPKCAMFRNKQNILKTRLVTN